MNKKELLEFVEDNRKKEEEKEKARIIAKYPIKKKVYNNEYTEEFNIVEVDSITNEKRYYKLVDEELTDEEYALLKEKYHKENKLFKAKISFYLGMVYLIIILIMSIFSAIKFSKVNDSYATLIFFRELLLLSPTGILLIGLSLLFKKDL